MLGQYFINYNSETIRIGQVIDPWRLWFGAPLWMDLRHFEWSSPEGGWAGGTKKIWNISNQPTGRGGTKVVDFNWSFKNSLKIFVEPAIMVISNYQLLQTDLNYLNCLYRLTGKWRGRRGIGMVWRLVAPTSHSQTALPYLFAPCAGDEGSQ